MRSATALGLGGEGAGRSTHDDSDACVCSKQNCSQGRNGHLEYYGHKREGRLETVQRIEVLESRGKQDQQEKETAESWHSGGTFCYWTSGPAFPGHLGRIMQLPIHTIVMQPMVEQSVASPLVTFIQQPMQQPMIKQSIGSPLETFMELPMQRPTIEKSVASPFGSHERAAAAAAVAAAAIAPGWPLQAAGMAQGTSRSVQQCEWQSEAHTHTQPQCTAV
eukprot:1136405-Pelagomonas_calceolata.AAC.1